MSVQDLCGQCPRTCFADRSSGTGFCGMPRAFRVARVACHPWEEPCLSSGAGSGTIFFCGCNLRCVFCQNREISHGALTGQEVSPKRLAGLIFRLRREGACNINLVTPTHYALELIPVLREVRKTLDIPVIYNCGGYESVETLKRLAGLIDVYLPDCKYFSTELSARYSAAPDYFPVAVAALHEMLRQTGRAEFSPEGTMLRGVLVRHLVLPGCRQDSADLLHALFREFGNDAFTLSLMRQYTPEFAAPDADKNLHRKLTSFEYESVLRVAEDLGFHGYRQEKASADRAFTPDFREQTF